MLDALPALMESRSQDKGALIPDTIMTTDTVRKACCHSFMTSAGERKIAVTAKGAGMIAPNMATLLCFALTDASIARADLDRIFRSCVNRTLNAISIDGDMSTNDTAIILSPEGTPLSGDDLAAFETALHDALLDISRQLVRDGEGATKCVDVIVTGALNEGDARRCAKSVAESLLVKTAFFGNDPNWGRIACAAGYSGAELDQSRISISFDDCMILEKGTPVYERLDTVAAVIRKSDFTVTVDLALGDATFRYITSDISFDYVRINAEYST
jgi:glutamate N-acetyltransferase / amino-acid N-acetyltransferase